MTLEWKSSDSKPSPFDAAVGNRFEYVVHHAQSNAKTDTEIAVDLEEAIFKAVLFAEQATGPRAKNFLLLWDVVYGSLTIVTTDETLFLDAKNVVRCDFLSIETKIYAIDIDDTEAFERFASETSTKVQAMLTKILMENDIKRYLGSMPVLFSDEDRASVSVDYFKATPIAL